MNPVQESDQALRGALLDALQAAPEVEHDALQARVMAQWAQRHPAASAELAGVAGALASEERARRRSVWLLAGSLLLAVALALGWANRPEPSLDELMQPDVLSQIGLGEL